METFNKKTLQKDFTTFDISESHGFVIKEPKMPVLSTHHLNDHRELMLAHLVLGFISMGYVWQEGEHAPAQGYGNWGVLEVMHAMGMSDLLGIQNGLVKVTQSLKKMKETFKLMHDHVDPTVFHGTMRIFMSGWRDNPMLPNGLLYEGVSNEPILLSGGSAAQSSAIQCFDALLRIQHDDGPGAYLLRMRDYMPPVHRQLIETLSAGPSLRDLIISCSDSDLCQAYKSCVSAMVDLRQYHLNAVTKYIIVPGNRTVQCPLRGGSTMLNTTGTGGSNPMVFLKAVRDTTQKALILLTEGLPSDSTCVKEFHATGPLPFDLSRREGEGGLVGGWVGGYGKGRKEKEEEEEEEKEEE
ncbi:hypothetical protein INR49_013274 [Caranx melampygus]|nr:hypothetical protein INR49_013274 [Caranx melampygus]